VQSNKICHSERSEESNALDSSSPFGLLRMTYFASFLLVMMLLGCSPISVSDEQKKQVVAADPSFEKVLQEKSEYDSVMASLRVKFLSEKNTYEAKVSALRREFEAKRTQFYAQTRDIKLQLEPQREKIKSDLAIVTEELKNKLKNQKAIKDMLNQAKSIIEGKLSSGLSEKDRLEWHDRFNVLTEEYSKVSQETDSLREKINILKLKHRSLIQ